MEGSAMDELRIAIMLRGVAPEDILPTVGSFLEGPPGRITRHDVREKFPELQRWKATRRAQEQGMQQDAAEIQDRDEVEELPRPQQQSAPAVVTDDEEDEEEEQEDERDNTRRYADIRAREFIYNDGGGMDAIF